jgi:hypothetical protein
MVWGTQNSRCAFADCRQELVEHTADGPGTDSVSEVANIVARVPDGPRGS